MFLYKSLCCSTCFLWQCKERKGTKNRKIRWVVMQFLHKLNEWMSFLSRKKKDCARKMENDYYLGNWEFRISFCPYFLHAWLSSVVWATMVHVCSVFLRSNLRYSMHVIWCNNISLLENQNMQRKIIVPRCFYF